MSLTTPLATALYRAKTLSPRDEALGSVVRGALGAAAGLAMMISEQLWVGLLALPLVFSEEAILRALRPRWVEQEDGRRPLPAEEPWFDPGTTTPQKIAAGIGFLLMLASMDLGPACMFAAGVALSYAERQAKWALIGAAIWAACHFGKAEVRMITLFFVGVGILMDGAMRWWRLAPAPIPARATGEVETDLLRLLAELKSADTVWLQRSSGLAQEAEVAAALERLRERGFIVPIEREGRPAFGLTAEGQRFASATPPPLPAAERPATERAA